VRRINSLAALILAGCASRPPIAEPTIKSVPPALIADSGASLYVVEGRDDVIEDWGGKEPEWLGPEALKKVLKYALTQKDLILVGHADFQVAEGIPTEVTLFNPDSKGHRSTDGNIGFRIRLKATTAADAKKCALEWEAEQLTDLKGKNGEVDRRTEVISKSKMELPFGASKIIRQPKGEGREYLLLLRVISLQEP